MGKIVDFIFSYHIWLLFGLYLFEELFFGTSFVETYLFWPFIIVFLILFVGSILGITKFGLNWRGRKNGSSPYDYDSDDLQ
jgi:hypothetical protein